MPKGKSHHVHHHFPQYTNVIVMVVILAVGVLAFDYGLFSNEEPLRSPSSPGLSMHFTMDAVEKNADDLFKGGVLVKGVRGEAVCFDGSNDYIHLGRNSKVRKSNQITYMFWTKTSKGEGGYVLGAGAKGGHGYGGVFLSQDHVSYVWTPSNPSRDTWAKSVNPYPFLISVWTHVAITVD